jgi:methylated-DNA-[protein]-cysteine S-methyltransferase
MSTIEKNKQQFAQQNLITRWMQTPLGPLEIAVCVTNETNTYKYIEFKLETEIVDHQNKAQHPLLDLAQIQLQEYIDGTRKEFSQILEHQSDYGTDFQRQVWCGLTQIPYGETCSYLDLATKINNPKAVRAVGAANGKNPLAIVVPCHRVIGANGTLTGYAGGLDKKQWLLELEQQQI